MQGPSGYQPSSWVGYPVEIKLLIWFDDVHETARAIVVCTSIRLEPIAEFVHDSQQANPQQPFPSCLSLCFKASPSAKPFIWKLILFTCKWTNICMWIKLIFKSKALHLDSLWSRGERQLKNDCWASLLQPYVPNIRQENCVRMVHGISSNSRR